MEERMNLNSSRIRPALGALLLSTLAVTAFASSQTYGIAQNAPAAAEFNFRVTLIPVPGKVNAVSAALNFDVDNITRANGTITVNLNKLQTGIELRDEHAKGYLGTDKHSNAVFTLSKITGATKLEVGKSVTATAVGSFNLNGIAKPLSAPITLKRNGNSVAVSTAFNVALADHKIEIFGADPLVDVKVNFTLAPKTTP
jgi:polyisoprenoid-binding protein YceI